MHVTLIGSGRLGKALALRSAALGHDCRLLFRRTPPAALRSERITCLPLSDAAPRPTDRLVVIAAPAQPDAQAEDAIADYLAQVGADRLVASGAAYPGAPHDRWSKGRRYVRFLATPAAADPGHEALLLIDGDGRNSSELLEWFGRATVASGAGGAFHRHAHILMATPLHLAALAHLSPGTALERRLAAATLREASVLLDLAEGDPQAAAELCATPGGLTVRLVERLMKFLPTLDAETGNDSRL